MPLMDRAFVGTNADGTPKEDYCQFCFQKGAFTEPELTLEEMVEKSIHFMSTNLGYAKEEAERLSREVIPGLRRWRE